MAEDENGDAVFSQNTSVINKKRVYATIDGTQLFTFINKYCTIDLSISK